MGQVSLSDKLSKKIIFGQKRIDFLLVKNVREREKKKSKLLSSIYGIPSVGISRAKSESSSTRRGLRVGTKNEGFH